MLATGESASELPLASGMRRSAPGVERRARPRSVGLQERSMSGLLSGLTVLRPRARDGDGRPEGPHRAGLPCISVRTNAWPWITRAARPWLLLVVAPGS